MFIPAMQVKREVDFESGSAMAAMMENAPRYAEGWQRLFDSLLATNSREMAKAKGAKRSRLHRRGLAIVRARDLTGALLVNVLRDIGANVGQLIEQEYPGTIGKTLAATLREADTLDYCKGGEL